MQKCAHGGSVDCPECYAEGGVVERIMRKRSAPKPGEEPADFDYLDQIPPEHDADYTGANSGDELGMEDEDDKDIVIRIMRQRAKDKNPRPA